MSDKRDNTTAAEKPAKGPRKTTYRKLQKLKIDLFDLNPPPMHTADTPWTEDEAIAEMEFLCRYVGCSDPTKIFFNQALFCRGYKEPELHARLAREFGGKVLELYELALRLRAEKVAMLCLNKQMDPKFGIFAMQNISKWRQTQTVDVATNVMIRTKDYKGTQEIITERMNKAKKEK